MIHCATRFNKLNEFLHVTVEPKISRPRTVYWIGHKYIIELLALGNVLRTGHNYSI